MDLDIDIETFDYARWLRNLVRLTNNDQLVPWGKESLQLSEALGDAFAIRRSNLHPLEILDWYLVSMRFAEEPVAEIGSSLFNGFHAALRFVEPFKKKTHLIINSQLHGDLGLQRVPGAEALTMREVQVALPLVLWAQNRQSTVIDAWSGARIYGTGFDGMTDVARQYVAAAADEQRDVYDCFPDESADRLVLLAGEKNDSLKYLANSWFAQNVLCPETMAELMLL